MLSRKSIKNILIFFCTVIFLMLLTVIITFPLSPSTMSSMFYNKTGLKLVVNGKVRLSISPKTHFKIYDAYITNKYGSVISSFEALDIEVDFLSLFTGHPVIEQISISKPKIYLDILYKARGNSNVSIDTQSSSSNKRFSGTIKQFILENGTVYKSYNENNVKFSTLNINSIFRDSKLFTLLSFNQSNVSFSSTILTDFLKPTLSLSSNPANFEVVTLVAGGTLGTLTSSINTHGQIAYSEGTTYIKANTSINNLDLNLLSALYGFSNLTSNHYVSKQTTESSNEFFNNIRASINLSATNTLLYNNRINNLDATINIDKSNVLTDFTAQLLDTKLLGKIIFYSNNNVPYLYSNLKIDNLSLAKLYKISSNKLINGCLRAEINLGGFIKDVNSFKASLTGTGNFHISGGNINGDKLSFVTDMLSTLVGIPINVNPVPFKDISGTFEVKDGLITNNDLVIDSEKCYLTGKGYLHLYYNTINYILIPSKFIATIYDGIETGFTITGNLSKPTYKIDLDNYINYLNHKLPKPTFKNIKKNEL